MTRKTTKKTTKKQSAIIRAESELDAAEALLTKARARIGRAEKALSDAIYKGIVSEEKSGQAESLCGVLSDAALAIEDAKDAIVDSYGRAFAGGR